MKTLSQEDLRDKKEALLYKLVGDGIKKVRGKMSQAQLAELLDVSRASVVNIEAGRQHAPLFLLWRIAEELGVSLTSLLPEPTEMDQVFASLYGETQPQVDPKSQREIRDFIIRKSKPASK